MGLFFNGPKASTLQDKFGVDGVPDGTSVAVINEKMQPVLCRVLSAKETVGVINNPSGNKN